MSATGVPNIKKIRGRENISFETWNVRALGPAGKLDRPKAALLFWFFGDFRCGVLLFMVILVIYK